MQDLPSLIDVVDTSGLFPGEMLTAMIGDSVDDDNSQEHWLTYETDKPVAVAYFAPERFTSRTWNLYLIAVHVDHQGLGIGTQIMAHVESLLKSKGERLLIVETSDLAEFALTRKFYEGIDYTEEARIRDFYDDGDGKVVFWKKLN